MAAIAYGGPRMTLGADLVLALRIEGIPRFFEPFPVEDF